MLRSRRRRDVLFQLAVIAIVSFLERTQLVDMLYCYYWFCPVVTRLVLRTDLFQDMLGLDLADGESCLLPVLCSVGLGVSSAPFAWKLMVQLKCSWIIVDSATMSNQSRTITHELFLGMDLSPGTSSPGCKGPTDPRHGRKDAFRNEHFF
eukprot:s1744_g5.t1